MVLWRDGQAVGLIAVTACPRLRDMESALPAAISEIARPAPAPIPASPQSNPLGGLGRRAGFGCAVVPTSCWPWSL
jgi:hypothetical protein